jgi:hypothetical protein
VKEIQESLQMNDKNQLPVSVDTGIIKQNINYRTEHKRLWSTSKCTQTHKNKNQHQRYNMGGGEELSLCVILCHKNVWGDRGKSPGIPVFLFLF